MSKGKEAREQIERVIKYEKMLDEANALLAAGRRCARLGELAGELESYYTGPLWKRDFADDEAGRLPDGLKRGVLSEDAVYGLLAAYGELDPPVILETERLILRPWDVADAEECFRYAKDPLVGPAAGWPAHADVGETRRIIREVLGVPETYAIVLKETGLPVGSIGLHHSEIASGDDEAELGYWIGVPYWGRGLVPEAARETLRHAFEDLGLSRVWCACFDGNEKSKRVQEKLGFRYRTTIENAFVSQLGETRVDHVSLLTKDEWENGRRK